MSRVAASARSCRQRARPSMTGMSTSVTMTSGTPRRAASSARVPFSAVKTSMPEQCRKRVWICLMSGASSTMRTMGARRRASGPAAATCLMRPRVCLAVAGRCSLLNTSPGHRNDAHVASAAARSTRVIQGRNPLRGQSASARRANCGTLSRTFPTPSRRAPRGWGPG
jgi:hypothetical protein